MSRKMRFDLGWKVTEELWEYHLSDEKDVFSDGVHRSRVSGLVSSNDFYEGLGSFCASVYLCVSRPKDVYRIWKK